MRNHVAAAWAAMAALLVQCSGPEQSNAAASGASAQSAPVREIAEAPRLRTQLCDEPRFPPTGLAGPALFLSGVVPPFYGFPDDPADYVRSMYAPGSVAVALQLHKDHIALAKASLSQYLKRDGAGLRETFKQSILVAANVFSAQPDLVPAARRGRADGYGLEYQAPLFPLHVAYLILAIDRDYAAFEQRFERVLAARSTPDLRNTEWRRAEAPHRPPSFAVRDLGAVRAVAMYRLLRGDEDEAEKAMLFVLETRAVQNRGDRFMPYRADELIATTRAPSTTFRDLVAKPDQAPNPEPGCSDLYFFYTEWLDMRSRAAIAKKRRHAASAVAAESAALTKAVAPALLGAHVRAAQSDIDTE